MKILNFGSINIDFVYGVDRIASAGETIDSYSYGVFPGGKGLNQSIAMGRAGAEAYHAGTAGNDGLWLIDLLKENRINCSHIRIVDNTTGNALIQVERSGQNCIVLNGGANRSNTADFIREALDGFEAGDVLLLQNEINLIDAIIDQAFEKGMFIVMNPSPMNQAIRACDLRKVSLFILNEHEGFGLTGKKGENQILEEMHSRYPAAGVVLTLGASGAIYYDGKRRIAQSAYRVDAVDTTAAGDTFTGYFIAMMAKGFDLSSCLDIASKAAALAVSVEGAAASVPFLDDVENWK